MKQVPPGWYFPVLVFGLIALVWFGWQLLRHETAKTLECRLSGSPVVQLPGMPAVSKLIPCNDGDLDEDGIPDHRDWEITGPGTETLFEPMQIRLPAPGGTLQLDYDTAPEGALRIWRKPACQLRDPRPVKEGGDYVAPLGNREYYTPEELHFVNGEATFYIEGLTVATATITWDWHGPWDSSASIGLAVGHFSLDIDSDNNDKIDRTPKERSCKNRAGWPGRFIRSTSSKNQFNPNHVIHYANLANNATDAFVTAELTAGTPFPLHDLEVSIRYAGAPELAEFPDPNVKNVPNEYAELRGDHALRVWVGWEKSENDADPWRNPAQYTGTVDGGNYLTPNKRIAADRFFGVEETASGAIRQLQLEGLNGMPTTLTAQLYHKSGQLLAEDTIKATVSEVRILFDRRFGGPRNFEDWKPDFQDLYFTHTSYKCLESNVPDYNQNGIPDCQESEITPAMQRLIPALVIMGATDVQKDMRLSLDYPGGEVMNGPETPFPKGKPIRVWIAERPQKKFTRVFAPFTGHHETLGSEENYAYYLVPGKYYRADRLLQPYGDDYRAYLWVESESAEIDGMLRIHLGYVEPKSE